jgi:hypothetical protein
MGHRKEKALFSTGQNLPQMPFEILGKKKDDLLD